MTKQTIAVDLDDVLAANAEGFVKFSNQRWGTNLTIDDWSEHWSELWNVDHQEVAKRAKVFHTSGVLAKYKHAHEAKPVLAYLKQHYQLVILTSRRRMVEKETLVWVDKYYKGIFSGIHFAGFYDNDSPTALSQTKAELAKEVGADYIIDDQPKHCWAAAESGIAALLFGDYKWNRSVGRLPKGVRRVKDWQAVKEYFERIIKS